MQTKQNDQLRDQKPKLVVDPMVVVALVQPAQLVERRWWTATRWRLWLWGNRGPGSRRACRCSLKTKLQTQESKIIQIFKKII